MLNALYANLGSILCGAGAIVLARVLFPNVLRPPFHRRRCPRCWYDLAHTPGLTCSECGYTAKRSRQLHRRRRRYVVAAMAAVVSLGGYAWRVAPAVQAHGMVTAVPTTTLVLAAPWLRPDWQTWGRPTYPFWMHPGWGGGIPPKSSSFRTALYLDLAGRRLPHGEVWGWQEQLLTWNCNVAFEGSAPPGWAWRSPAEQLVGSTTWAPGQHLEWDLHECDADMHWTLETRREWPAGSPVYVYAHWNSDASTRSPGSVSWSFHSRLMGDPETPGLVPFTAELWVAAMHPPPSLWSDGLTCIGVPQTEDNAPRCRLSVQCQHVAAPLRIRQWHEVEELDVVLPTKIVRAETSVVSPVQLDVLTEVFQEHIRAEVVKGRFVAHPEPQWAINLGLIGWEAWFRDGDARAYIATQQSLRANAVEDLLDRTTFAVRAEVLDGDRVVAHGHWWINFSGNLQFRFHPIKLTVLDETAFSVDELESPLTLRLRGDAETALRDFEAQYYWDGEITTPIWTDRVEERFDRKFVPWKVGAP